MNNLSISEQVSELNQTTNIQTKTFCEQVLTGNYKIEFPVHSLPDTIRHYCQVVADCLCIPIEFTAIGALFACAVANGGMKKLKIGPYENLGIFWFLILADTGKQKSYPMKIMLSPIFKRDKESETEYRRIVERFKNLDKADQHKQKAPFKRKSVFSDFTSESVERQHYWNLQNGVGVFSDEITKYLGSLGKYNGAKDAEYARRLERYSNVPIIVDRMGNGLDDIGYSVFDSPENLMGGHQPSRIKLIVSKDSIESGDFARYNFFLPNDYRKGGVTCEIPEKESRMYEVLLHNIFGCSTGDYYSPDFVQNKHRYCLTSEAHKYYQEFKAELDEIHNRAKVGSYIRGIEGKSLEKASRYALLFQAIDDAFNSELSPDVSPENMWRAIEMTKYHFFTSLEVANMVNTERPLGLTKPQILKALTDKFPDINMSLLAKSLKTDRSNLYKMLK